MIKKVFNSIIISFTIISLSIYWFIVFNQYVNYVHLKKYGIKTVGTIISVDSDKNRANTYYATLRYKTENSKYAITRVIYKDYIAVGKVEDIYYNPNDLSNVVRINEQNIQTVIVTSIIILICILWGIRTIFLMWKKNIDVTLELYAWRKK